MLFNSVQFAIFFVALFALYYLPILRKAQVHILVAASLYFYFCGSGAMTLLLILSVAVNALLSHCLFRVQTDRSRALMALLGVTFNVLLLAVFKYGSLMLRSVRHVLPWEIPAPWLTQAALVSLPLGISFYCFEGISLIVDSRKKLFAEKPSLVDTARDTSFFMLFFPHLVSGPILRAAEFLPQIRPKSIRTINWYASFKWIVLGYFLKVFVADNLAAHCLRIYFPYFVTNGSVMNVCLLIAYSARIFADFAGYSYIALGLASLLGYDIPNNFNAPYISRSLREFWRRWHVSLSAWLRDYLFIPLGGSHCSRFRACFNVLFVMFLGGLWHGASWNFAIWGLLHGVALAIEHATLGKLKIPNSMIVELMQVSFTATIVTLLWLCFIFSTVDQLRQFLQHTVSDLSVSTHGDLESIILYVLPVSLLHFWHWSVERGWIGTDSVWRQDAVRSFILGLLIFLAIVNPGPNYAFIYFRF